MLRAILSVIVGYIVMALVVFVTFTAAYLAMGTENAFAPGSYQVSALWVVVSIVFGWIAAMIGGLVCAAISKGSGAPMALAVIVLVLGLAMAVPVMMASDEGAPAVRSENVAAMEAMQNARQPGWLAVANPIIGAVGVLLGARLRPSAKQSAG
jgi:hypothetical protein